MSQKSKILLKELLKEPVTLWQKYLFGTKNRVEKLLPMNKWPQEWKTTYYKGYARFEEVVLPKPTTLKNQFHQTLHNRHSARDFSKENLTLKELSTLLYYSAGIKDRKKLDLGGNRFYPSGGARYPLEVYLFSFHSELPKGLYHYYLKNHSLEQLLTFKTFDFKQYFSYPWVKKASCAIAISAVFPRTTIKYGERGYKLALMEAGHLAQNIYLTCAAQNIKCVEMLGFIDDNMNKLIDIDGYNEAVIITLALGK